MLTGSLATEASVSGTDPNGVAGPFNKNTIIHEIIQRQRNRRGESVRHLNPSKASIQGRRRSGRSTLQPDVGSHWELGSHRPASVGLLDQLRCPCTLRSHQCSATQIFNFPSTSGRTYPFALTGPDPQPQTWHLALIAIPQSGLEGSLRSHREDPRLSNTGSPSATGSNDWLVVESHGCQWAFRRRHARRVTCRFTWALILKALAAHHASGSETGLNTITRHSWSSHTLILRMCLSWAAGPPQSRPTTS